MKDFYITLPSNASMDVYPNNAISHFTTRLRNPLELSKGWEVALVEATVPTRWANIGTDEWMRIQVPVYTRTDDKPIRTSKRWLKRPIDGEFYESAEGIIDLLNRYIHFILEKVEKSRIGTEAEINLPRREYLKYHKETSTVSFDLAFQLQFTTNLALLLGYGSGDKKWVTIPRGPNNRMTDLSRGWTNIFVYTDVVEYQIVGDTLAPLIRVIPMISYKANNRMDHLTLSSIIHIISRLVGISSKRFT